MIRKIHHLTEVNWVSVREWGCRWFRESNFHLGHPAIRWTLGTYLGQMNGSFYKAPTISNKFQVEAAFLMLGELNYA